MPLGSQPVWLRSTPSDTSIFFQIFIKQEYDTAGWAPQHARLNACYGTILAAGQTPVIIDAGANIGLASRWFGERYPRAKIFAVEPEPANVAVLRRNVAHLANVTVLEGAVWDNQARLSIANPGAGAGAFRVVENDGHLRAYTISEITALAPQASLFIAKIDIEGGEDALFRGNPDWPRDAQLIVVETHDWLLPGAGTSRNFRRSIADLPIDLLARGENIFCFRTA
jgi:FkbM family methyltransferase